MHTPMMTMMWWWWWWYLGEKRDQRKGKTKNPNRVYWHDHNWPMHMLQHLEMNPAPCNAM